MQKKNPNYYPPSIITQKDMLIAQKQGKNIPQLLVLSCFCTLETIIHINIYLSLPFYPSLFHFVFLYNFFIYFYGKKLGGEFDRDNVREEREKNQIEKQIEIERYKRREKERENNTFAFVPLFFYVSLFFSLLFSYFFFMYLKISHFYYQGLEPCCN